MLSLTAMKPMPAAAAGRLGLNVFAAAMLCVTATAVVAAISTRPGRQALSTAAKDSDVAATATTIEHVLTSGEHPGLKWSVISDVVTSLKPLYQDEADRLLWFAGSTPIPALSPTLATIALAGEHGLDPADYDDDYLAEQMGGHQGRQALRAGARTFRPRRQRRCRPHAQSGAPRASRSHDHALGI